MNEPTVYSKGDTVPETGKYVCSPCGYHHTYQAGDQFGECISCLAGTNDGDPAYADGSALWEKASTKESTEQ